MNGLLIHPKTHQSVPLQDDIYATVKAISPYAAALAAQPGLDALLNLLEAPCDADYLRDQYDNQGGRKAVVRAAIRQFSD